jgi:cation diffusion facilitator family transporter
MVERTSPPAPDAIAIASIFVGLLVLALKFAAYTVTGSLALYSDALESIVNVVTATAAVLAIRFSALPADANHPYGHYKAEYFSVVLDGVLIVIAALAIFRAAYLGMLAPRSLEAPLQGLVINATAGVINAAWCYILIREGRRRRSLALAADGRHVLSDVLTSAGVLAGLVLSLLTGWTILDPLLAFLVGLNILWSGWSLIRESVGGLMDEAVSNDLLGRIREVISKSAAGALEAHDLRTRRAGRMTFIDFHLVVPGGMPVTDAHLICDEIERALRATVVDATITIHVEPEEKAKHHGVVVI